MSRSRTASGKPSQADRIASLRARVQEWQEEHDEEEVALMVAEFQGYSERNAMLIAMQCPTATEVHGFKAWLNLGRCVRKGETGIEILAPAGSASAAEATDSADATPDAATEVGTDSTGKRRRQFFRVAHVFDIAQTDPLPAQGERAA